ncbi:MAG: hypothetical protein LLG37_00215 [Spirochaetia bacterium]|nr:hypothetical protein [Spirochaetia bacterium]
MDDNGQQQDLEKIYKAVASDLLKGMAPDKAAAKLVRQGCPQEFANQFLDKVVSDIKEFDKTPQFVKYLINLSLERMAYGGMWIGIAVILKIMEMNTWKGSFVFNALALILIVAGVFQLACGITGYLGTVLSKGRGERIEQVYNNRIVTNPVYRFLLNASIICAAFFVFAALISPFISAIGLSVSSWLLKYGVTGGIALAVVTWIGGFVAAAWVRVAFILKLHSKNKPVI